MCAQAFIDPLFLVTVLLVSGLFIYATRSRWLTLFTFFFGAINVAISSANGFFRNTSALPPRMAFVVIPAIIFVIVLSSTIRLTHLKPTYLLAMHIFRIPVEYCLYHLFLQGEVPKGMTLLGWNFDILTGISAAVLLVMHQRLSLSLLKWWNYGGILLLAIVAVTGLLSAPSPLQWNAFDQPNVAVLRFPYALLPGLVVPLMFTSHFLMLRWISRRRKREALWS